MRPLGFEASDPADKPQCHKHFTTLHNLMRTQCARAMLASRFFPYEYELPVLAVSFKRKQFPTQAVALIERRLEPRPTGVMRDTCMNDIPACCVIAEVFVLTQVFVFAKCHTRLFHNDAQTFFTNQKRLTPTPFLYISPGFLISAFLLPPSSP